MTQTRNRVVQWATGNVGRAAARAIVERPELELVGAFTTSEGKHGRDVGELVGVAPLGVTATSRRDDIVALDADVVIHTPLPSLVHGDDPGRDVDDFCALLASGKDVITTVGYMYPPAHGDDLVDRLTDACRAGGSRFHGTGANPGWFGDVLPLVISGLSLSIERIAVQEISSFQHYPSPEIMFDMMGFGSTVDEFAARAGRHRAWLDGLFAEAVMMVAHGLDVEVTRAEVTSSMETVLAEADLPTAAGLVPTGTVAGQRWNWTASHDGDVVVSQETVWRMHEDVAPDWPVGDWSITVHGEPKMHLSLPHRWNRDVLGSTGAHALNAIPYLRDAPPGIVTFLDLPIVAGRGAWRPRTVSPGV